MFCAVAPAPELRQRFLSNAGLAAPDGIGAVAFDLARAAGASQPRYFGFNDGVILPPDRFPIGASASVVRHAAAQRAPLRGTVRVIVVLAEFDDKKFTRPAAEFEKLFFADAPGSVKDFYREVTGGLIDIVGEVVGPYTLPKKLSWYANGNFGIGKPTGEPRAHILAQDAATLADGKVDFRPYDNDGNGYVDAFVVVHAGSGGEQSGNSGDIWSHKWVLPDEYATDSTKIYAYLTIPEDAKLGVSAHELGHLLFGFPDLYDIDYSSEGVGNWCLMGGGSWNGGGDTPAHPSAWCKANQGWATVTDVAASGAIDVRAVAASREVFRLPVGAAGGSEYFLVENRQRTGFDSALPSDGLLVWHVDDSREDNTDESHYLVGLLQADGKQDLEHGANRGDTGDPFPGASKNRKLDGTTTPATKSYAGQDTGVALLDIPDSAATMSVHVSIGGAETGTDGTGGGGGAGGAVGERLAAVESQLKALQQTVAAAGAALGAAAGAPRTTEGSAWCHRSLT